MSTADNIASLANPQEFTRLCNALLFAEHGDDFLPIDDDRADGGNDGFLLSERRIFAMHCPKRPRNRGVDEVIRSKMVGDLGKAIALRDAGVWDPLHWTFVCNYPIPNHIAAEVVDIANEAGLTASWRGAPELALLAAKHPAASDAFPWLAIDSTRRDLAELSRGIEAVLGTTPGLTRLARNLPFEQPAYWPYRLFAAELRAGASVLDSLRRDFQIGITREAARRVPINDALDVSRQVFDELRLAVSNMAVLLNRADLDPMAEASDKEQRHAIVHLADALLASFAALLLQAQRTRAWVIPDELPELEVLRTLLVDLVRGPVAQFERFLAEYEAVVAQLPDHLPEESQLQDAEPIVFAVDVTLTVEPPDLVERIELSIDAIGDALISRLVIDAD